MRQCFRATTWLAVLLAFSFVPANLLAGTQGPDAGGYSVTDSAAYSFVDVSAGGASILAGSDDDTALLQLPFPFTLYSTTYTWICVSTNGAAWLITDPAACQQMAGIDFANADLTAASSPHDLAAILPLWSDLEFVSPGAGSVFYQTIGSTGSRRYVIQWNKAFPQGSARPVTFEAILSELGNTITFQYQTVVLGGGNPASAGATATVGIRNMGGRDSGQQLQWSYKSGVVADSSALAFTLGGGPLPVVLTSPANGGTGYTNPVLTWTSSAGATAYDIYVAKTFPPVLVGTTTYGTFTPTVSAGSTYNWNVVARNGAGQSASSTWTFTTAQQPPSVPAYTLMTFAPAALTFNAAANGAPLTQTFNVTFKSSIPLGYLGYYATATDTLGWLNVSPVSAITTPVASTDGLFTYQATLTVNVLPAGVTPGTYNAGVSVLIGSTSLTLPVTFVKSASAAIVTAAPVSLSFTYRQGQALLPAAQNLAITSDPSGFLITPQAVLTGGANWLSVPAATLTFPATLPVSVNASTLAPGTYNGRVRLLAASATALEVPVTLTVVSANAPVVRSGGVVPIYSKATSIAPGSWLSLYGSNLATTTAMWAGDFPTTLGGVTVTINAKPAFLWYVSPGQLNVQAPDDTGTGTVTVVVTNENGSTTSTVTLAAASPSFSLFGDGRHLAGYIPTPDGSGQYGGGTYDLIGPANAFTFATRPVAVGETVVLFGVGFGPTNPPVRAGAVFSGAAPTVNPVTVTVGGVPATVTFAGITSAGLYQLNVVVPGVSSGDQAVVATANGVQTQMGVVLAVK